MNMISLILDFMRVEGSERVACASYMLRDDARIWWDVVSQQRNVAVMTWEEFKSIFNEKYYIVVVRATKVDEFINLTQNRSTVTEYAIKFDRLAKFAPDLVPTDASRRDRFVQGLNVMITRDVNITLDPATTTYGQAVDKALTAERAEDRIWKGSGVRRDAKRAVPPFVGSSWGSGPSEQKRRVPDSFTPPISDRRVRGASTGRQGGSDNWRSFPMCPRCRRRHQGECRSRACFVCGSASHLRRDCPQVKKEEQKQSGSLAPARVFTLTQTEAEASPSVVTCHISSAGSLYTALFDSGATHSFVSARVIDQLCRPSGVYASGFQTLLPTGELVVSRKWIRALPVEVDGREFFVDLIKLEMDDFDMILGMDWLSKYGATIDCRRKMVTFEPEGEVPFVFVGSVSGPRVPMISALRARDLMQEGCIGFLASVVDTSRVVSVDRVRQGWCVSFRICFQRICQGYRLRGRLTLL
ncbi:uncharacterized protein LOC133800456 isoform X1 [Humulus lupulus]|uniref:uncharacterized protein LOC133800456 isoform X1 n=1 Tax=Humulus lupulus TaxID=3486 RepID=UPI002B402331|nr:uncharacterized protein LOC133800456 isoform X1 [Humulus lupulus]